MRQSSFQRLIGLLSFLSLVGASLQATDAEMLLQLQSDLNVTFSGWSAATVGSFCDTWIGVSCNGEGRLSTLNLNPRPGVPEATARVPTVLKNLTTLTQLQLNQQNLWGPFPKEVFQFPNLTLLNLKGAPVTIEWPSLASSSLREVILYDTNITTAVPDVFDWSTLGSLDLRRTEVRCPLPSGLVSRWSQVGSPALFGAYTTLEITNNRLCGQIDMVNVPGAVTPVYGVKSTETPALTFAATYKNVRLEFYDHEVRIFGVLKNGTVWREDFFTLNIPPLVPSGRTGQMRPFSITPFQSVGWTVPNRRITATATLKNILNQVVETSLIFEFDRDDGNIVINGASLKFSYTATNVNTTYSTPNVIFHMIAGYHTQLSNPGDPPIYCGEFRGQSVACQSTVSDVTFGLELGIGTFTTARVGVRNAKIDLSFGYGLNGTRDGVDLWVKPNATELEATQYLHNLGHADFTDKYHEFGLANLLRPTPPVGQQAMYLIVDLNLVPFTQLIYDPDISLSLIFDTTSDFPPAAGPVTTGSLATVSNNDVAIAAGVVVAIIVVAAVIVAFVIWKRRKSANLRARDTIARRLNTSVKDESATPAEAPQPSSDDRKGRKWKKSTLRAVRVTNITDDE